MSSNRNIIIVVIVGVLLLGALFAWIYSMQERFVWVETFDIESKEPYGNYVIHDLLQDYYADYEFYEIDDNLAETLDLNSISCPANYVFIGRGPYYSKKSVSALLKFVEQGNNVFISSLSMSGNLHDSLKFDGCNYWNGYDDFLAKTANMHFEDEVYNGPDSYEYRFIQYFDSTSYYWLYYDDMYSCEYDPNLVILGNIDEVYTNFFSYQYGKGHFYFHTTPLVFSNYYLTLPDKLEYPEKVLSYLPPGDIYWDERSKMPDDEDDVKQSSSAPPLTPLEFVLKQDSLRWALYLIVASVLLYLLFHSKRRQKAIPVVEPYENTSMEFVQTMGDLYFIQNDHRKLAQQKMRLFKSHLRSRYQVSTQLSDDEIVKRISQKAEIDNRVLERIFNKFKVIDATRSISVDDLIEFNNLIDHFYKIAK